MKSIKGFFPSLDVSKIYSNLWFPEIFYLTLVHVHSWKTFSFDSKFYLNGKCTSLKCTPNDVSTPLVPISCPWQCGVTLLALECELLVDMMQTRFLKISVKEAKCANSSRENVFEDIGKNGAAILTTPALLQ